MSEATEDAQAKEESHQATVDTGFHAEITSRRSRLEALSSRMNQEFGSRGEADGGDDWLKNLHPWHKRILSKPNSLNGTPDRLDTPTKEISFDHRQSTPTTSRMDQPQLVESVSRRARLKALTDRMRKDFDTSGDASVEDNDSLTRLSWHKKILSQEYPDIFRPSEEVLSPPPSEPPPSLPSIELRSPPPLPPRNPALQLPTPVDTPTAATLEVVTLAGRKDSKAQANSTESVCPNSENGTQRKRGHMKTLSLDRDFALARLQGSPFPPPSSKSNSLTRQNVATHQEEELRRIEAEGVINDLTSDLQITEEKEHLDPIASCSSSPASNSQKPTEKPRRERAVDIPICESDLDTPPLKTIQESTSDCSLPFVTAAEHRFNLSDSSSLNAPLDPISRDVERRLSMKMDRSLAREFQDDLISGHSSMRSSSIDQAKYLAKTATTYASSIFRGAISKVKQVTHAGSQSSKENEEETDSEDEQSEAGSTSHTVNAVVRPRKTKKGPFDFQHLKVVQEINHEHSGPVWVIKFSACGRLLATAGADCILRVWCLTTHIQHFQGMRERYQRQPMDFESAADFPKGQNSWETFEPPTSSSCSSPDRADEEDPMPTFAAKPFASYKGHVADILDLSWSKNYFILSSGMDRTAKLWHISRNECLCCFQHQDFVTSVSFLPKDDRYFVTGSLDGRIRIWNIPEKKVVFWNEVEEKLITALTFVKNGKFIVVGTYYGKCYFYTSELKYHTVISTSSRSKQSMGHKVTGLSVHGDKLLVTFNDSRIHMYDIRDKVLICKFRGAQHERSQIRGSFSPDGRHVICGSEDKFIYLWRTSDAQASRRDRNSMWERVRAHKTTVTVALFAPDPQLFLSKTEKRKGPQPNTNVIASADLDGSIKIMLNRATTTTATLKESPLAPSVAASQQDIVQEVLPLQDNLCRANSVQKVNF